MNPYDDMGAPGTLSAEALTVWIRSRMGSMGSRERRAWGDLVAALEREPKLSQVWLLLSRSGGQVHPYDAALGELAGAASGAELDVAAIGGSTERPADLASQREGALRDLVALPELDAERMYLEGVRVGRSEEE